MRCRWNRTWSSSSTRADRTEAGRKARLPEYSGGWRAIAAPFFVGGFQFWCRPWRAVEPSLRPAHTSNASHAPPAKPDSLNVRHQLTGNAGLYHVARELSRRGWHVMPTVRNARGADLYAASDDETRVLSIQSKALSKRAPVPLGGSLQTLRSRWWVITGLLPVLWTPRLGVS